MKSTHQNSSINLRVYVSWRKFYTNNLLHTKNKILLSCSLDMNKHLWPLNMCLSWLSHSLVYPMDLYEHFLWEKQSTYVTQKEKGNENAGGDAWAAIQNNAQEFGSEFGYMWVRSIAHHLFCVMLGKFLNSLSLEFPPFKIRYYLPHRVFISPKFDNSCLIFNRVVNLIIL